MIVIAFFIAHWYLCLFSQTFFLHRYAAHGSFRMSTFWERFFFIFCYVAQGASYISPRAYAIVHRMHHAYTDTEDDPHSPAFSRNVFTMMWRTRDFILGVLRDKMPIEARFSKNVPDWRTFDLIASHPISRFAWIGAYIAFYIAFAPSAWFYLLLPVHAAMGAVQGAIVNWNAHRRGYRNFEVNNHSENLMRVDIFFLGESYHNNHHKFPSRVNMAMKRFEFDPTYQVIRFFNWLGILRIVSDKRVSRPGPEPQQLLQA
ncbi:acyl-CoA desaturase [Taibaiella koreensis]|uniref:acyl-CoA desaturase n=1 Tax=Taibaiella koreensis TaxID=1268548 RepID=UPI000E59C2FE|nr:acyl-CoA desaturase [Taibaiella koreensis]